MKRDRRLLRLILATLIASGWLLPWQGATQAAPTALSAIVEPTSGLVTTEGGGIATFTIRLSEQPSSPVKFRLWSSDDSEGRPDPDRLNLTSGNWNEAQTVTVTGLDDGWVDGDVPYHITVYSYVTGYLRVDATNLDDDGGPQASDDSEITQEDTPVTTAVLANDSGLDSTPLSLTIAGAPAYGSAAVNGDNSVTYTPAQNYHGEDQYDYQVCDSGGQCDTARVQLSVESVNDAPVANDDRTSLTEGVDLRIDVLANDTDVDGDPLEIASVTNPANGTASIAGGLILYVPDSGFTGTDTFSYSVSDGQGGSDSASVVITVRLPGNQPVAADDFYNLGAENTLTVAAPGVLGNDVSPGGTSLQAVLKSEPTHGTLTLNADGSFTYTPQAGYIGADQFTYTANDENWESNPANVQITIPDRQPPAVTWVLPAAVEQRVDVGSEVVKLEVRASDNVAIDHVNFFRWDAAAGQFVDIGTDSTEPFQIDLDCSTLNPAWNQVFAKAYDTAGNVSERQYIWLYRVDAGGSNRTFLPIIIQ